MSHLFVQDTKNINTAYM